MYSYSYCCSEDGHGLSYPGFSVVFIQTFSIHHQLKFCVDDSYVSNPHNLRSSELENPLTLMSQSIEKQIFVSPPVVPALMHTRKYPFGNGYYELHKNNSLYLKSDGIPVTVFPSETVYRFTMRGFDFELPVTSEGKSEPEVVLSGHVSVELSLFFGHTVSITYRFFFDGDAAKITDAETGNPAAAVTDHIIALLSTYLGAEFWSKDGSSEEEHTDINLETEMRITNFWFSEDGVPLANLPASMVLSGKGRTFDGVASIYKKFIYRHCTAFAPDASRSDRKVYIGYRERHKMTSDRDFHYAMVDIWENLQHIGMDGMDLFEKRKSHGGLSEAELINHIRDFHKPELIGLMTLYPGEWPYRDSSAYEHVCGENIAIDTDDLVLAGTNLSVVIGTYGRRGSAGDADNQGAGVDWTEHLKERARYRVSWPEYLMILQIVLAKKYRIGLAKDQLIEVTLDTKGYSTDKLIELNADLSMRLSRMIVQLDVVKYSKFASHVVMFERTTRRLGLEKDMEELKEITSMVDSSLRNLSDYKEIKSDMFLNSVLAAISVISAFELLFQESEMPFLEYFHISSDSFAAAFVAIVAAAIVFALLIVAKHFVKLLWNNIIKR